MFLGNFLAGGSGAFNFIFLHKQILRLLNARMKKKNADFTPSAVLMFPAPEIILFMMYYNGIVQSSLVVVVVPCVGPFFRVLGGLVCASIIAVIAMMMMQIRSILSDGHVHGGKSKNDFGSLNPHLTFEHKFENGHLTVGRYKKALTMKGMGKSGKWKAGDTVGKIAMVRRREDEAKSIQKFFLHFNSLLFRSSQASLSSLFKKFGATGLTFYFINIIRKTLFTISLTVIPQIMSEKQSGPVQLMR